MIDVTCKCGHTFLANGKYAGQQVRCPECKQPVPVPVAAPADAEVWNSFQRHLSTQLDRLIAVAWVLAYRLAWVVFLLALLVGGCTYQSIVVVSHR